MVTVADTASGLPPVVRLAMQHATNAPHSAGYLITGGVQSKITPFIAVLIAPLGVVLL
jgi:hypothetical protein